MIGWDEYKDGVKYREQGILSSFELGEEYANELIMKARKMIGIIDEEIEENFEDESDDESIISEDNDSKIKSEDN